MGIRNKSKHWIALIRSLVEIAGILFLFYSNLLMGEFNRHAERGKSLETALRDVATGKNLIIGLITATVGFSAWGLFRRWLSAAERQQD